VKKHVFGARKKVPEDGNLPVPRRRCNRRGITLEDASAMPKAVAPSRSLALSWLRQAAGWSREELAAAEGVHPGHLGHLETGFRELDHERLVDLAGRMGLGRADVDAALLAAEVMVRPEVPRRGEGEGPEVVIPPEEETGVAAAARRERTRGQGQRRRKRAERASVAPARERHAEDPTLFDEQLARMTAARLGLAMAALVSPRVLALLHRRRIEAARREAAQRWKELQEFGGQERRLIVERLEEFQTWAVAERLAEESTRVAATAAGAATALASLAVRVVELADVGEGMRSRLLGFTRSFVANGLRAESRLREADLELEAAKCAWSAGEDPHGILPEWRLWDLEASLRRDQGRFAEALELLDRALAAAPSKVAGRILIKKGSTLEEAGNSEGAAAALRLAEPLVRSSGTLRDQWTLVFNLTVNLCHLGQYAKAWEQLPGPRQLAQRLGNELDLLKVEWLSGRVAVGLGQRTEAYRILEHVREDYAAGKNPLAMAMVSLELAVLYLEDGRTQEVRALAEFMVQTFIAEGVEPEAVMAVRLFHEAARQEAATVEEARRLLAFLEKAAGVKALVSRE
jgi:transcriptional regulator with XRE-family HTH domain